MKNKFIIPIILLLGAGAFWWWNSKRIAALKAELERLKSQPIPSRTDIGGWTAIIRTLVALGQDVYKEFRPGGAFYNGKNTLGDLDINEIIKSIA